MKPEPFSLQGRFTWPNKENWPVVPIIFVSANMDKSILFLLRHENVQGMIIAGVGHGNAPRWLIKELSALSSKGKSVVRSTRLNTGQAYRNLETDDDDLNFIACRSLSPQKSQILLQLLIANYISEPLKQQGHFDYF